MVLGICAKQGMMCRSEGGEDPVIGCIKRTFNAVDFEIIAVARRDGENYGSTAVMALQLGNVLYVAHAGGQYNDSPQLLLLTCSTFCSSEDLRLYTRTAHCTSAVSFAVYFISDLTECIGLTPTLEYGFGGVQATVKRSWSVMVTQCS